MLESFPTAYGAGAYTTGGRGGIIVHVTSLNDSGVGSLRHALEDASNNVAKIIVFDVSGVIQLNSDININGVGAGGSAVGNITIAGQTAPEGGITLYGGQLRFSWVDNIIIRYIKGRGNGLGTAPTLTMVYCKVIIVDHVSASFFNGTIMTVGSYTDPSELGGDITVQNCLIANATRGHIIGENSNQVSNDFGSVSVLRNTYYSVGWRVPGKFGGAMEVDVVNNAVHGWTDRLMRFDQQSFTLNHIGNYYQSNARTGSLNHTMWTDGVGMNPQIYNSDNFMSAEQQPPNYATDESVAWTPFASSANPINSNWFVNAQNPIQGKTFSIYNSSQVLDEVVQKSGAYKYLNADGTFGEYRDVYDQEFINLFIAKSNDARTPNRAIVINDIPTNTRPSNYYNEAKSTDIPEVWFDANVPSGETATDLAPSGYMWIEEFVNEVDGDSPAPPPPPPPPSPTGKLSIQIKILISN